jgi:Asp-tRNA(Asn)/Glu-tRNA(Gln) amidotransferase A subunit family amidase
MVVGTVLSSRLGAALVAALGLLASGVHAQMTQFAVEEATVRSIHGALAAGRVTCEQIVRAHLARIDAYDRKGPSLRAVLTVNPRAVSRAQELDRAGNNAPRGPLHCIPILLKDNFDTADMPTTGGSVTLAKSVPPDDAFVVKRLRAAGAVILGKTNLTELALTGTTVSSFGGQTLNPYDLTRTPGGSSGGTGAAIAASFAVLGTGSDTGQSIRSPASAASLVGVRPTHGLISRDGIMPFSPTQDEIGPITRTVEDAARMLDVMAGYDPADPGTAFSAGHVPATYLSALDANGLRGARIGVLTEFFGTDAVHRDVNHVVDAAIDRMKALGATIERIAIPNLDALTRDLSVTNFELRPAFDAYLASLGPAAPVTTFDAFMARNEFHPSLRGLLEDVYAIRDGLNSPEYRRQLARRTDLRQALMTAFASHRLAAILYPHQRRLVVPIGEAQVERNGVLSNSTGFPAVSFPGGFSTPTASAPLGVPVGLEILGPEWTEPALLRIAYAFEQGAHPRKAPASTPPLK